MNSDLNSVQIADIFWLLLITTLSKSDSDLMHVSGAFIADLPIVRSEEFEREEFKREARAWRWLKVFQSWCCIVS